MTADELKQKVTQLTATRDQQVGGAFGAPGFKVVVAVVCASGGGLALADVPQSLTENTQAR